MMGLTRLFSAIFGLTLLGLGIAVYMPDYISDGLLFGVFEIDDVLSIFYIIIGGLGLLATLSGITSRFYFKVFGLLFALVTILGFVLTGDLYLFHVNLADNILHLVLGVIALFFGFLHSSSSNF